MAYYLVRADPQQDRLSELHDRLSDGEFASMQPFGPSLTIGLQGARFDTDTGDAVWEEEDDSESPFPRERAAVLDEYFDDIRVEQIEWGDGWSQIETLPSLWSELA